MSTYEKELSSLNELWNLKKFLSNVKIVESKNKNCINFFLNDKKYGTIVRFYYDDKTYSILIHQGSTLISQISSLKKQNDTFIQDVDDFVFKNKDKGIIRVSKNGTYDISYEKIYDNKSLEFLSREKEDICWYYQPSGYIDPPTTTFLRKSREIFYIELIVSLFFYYEENNIFESLKKYYKDDGKNKKYDEIIESLDELYDKYYDF